MPTLDTYVGPQIAHHGRTPAFRSLGTIFSDGTTVEDGLDQAYLSGWNVRTEPLTVVTSDGMFPMPRHQVIMRDNPATGTPEPIAPSGKVFKPVQPEELAEFAALLLDDSDLVLDSAGSVDNGRRVFMVLRSPESVTYGAGDKVHPFLVAATGTDGSLSTIVRPMFMRIACTNQLSSVLYGKGVVEFAIAKADSRKSLGAASCFMRFSSTTATTSSLAPHHGELCDGKTIVHWRVDRAEFPAHLPERAAQFLPPEGHPPGPKSRSTKSMQEMRRSSLSC